MASQWITQEAKKPLRMFGILLLLFEVIILLFFGIFVRMETTIAGDTLQSQRYMAFQDINVMILLGFGLLYSFAKTNSLSSLIYTFLVNLVVMQLYVLFSNFWKKVILGFANTNYYIAIQQQIITKSSYCAASVLIALGAFIGRVGPKQMLIVAILQTIAYSFNQVMVYDKIQTFDAGGTTTVHTFGAFFGLGISWILSKKVKPIFKSQSQSNPNSNMYALIGTIFLWIYYPSFNFGLKAQSFYQQNQIIANTLYSLTGSCFSTFIVTAFIGKRLVMSDILNATVAGGVAIGACSGFLYQPAVAISIGIVTGATTTLGFCYLSSYLKQKIQLYDTCGINNLHGLPGILGGIFSAMIIASYKNGFDPKVSINFPTNNSPFIPHGTFLKQGGLQIAGTFTSLGFGLLFGIITGFIIRRFYNENADNFYDDKAYIQIKQTDSGIGNSSKSNLDPNDQINKRLVEQ